MNQRIAFIFAAAIATFITVNFQNCGQKDIVEAARNNATSLGSLNCKITPQSFVTLNSGELPSAFVSAKVQLSELNSASGKVDALSKISASRLPASHQVDLVLKPHCVQNSESQNALTGLIAADRLIKNVGPEFIQTATVTLPDALDVGELSALAENDPCVVGVSNSGVVKAFAEVAAPNDAGFGRQTYLPLIKAPESWPFFGDNITEDVIYAVIDTGLQTTHPDLQANLWVNTRETAGDGIDNDNNGCIDDINGCNFSGANPSGNINDDNSHGTHVAGLSAGKNNNSVGVAGVMGFRIKLMGVKTLGANGSGSFEGIANGIRYAADNGVQVINMSLGGAGEFAAVGDAIRYAVNKGVMIVVAAGNDNTNNDNRFITPASFAATIPQMLVVASVDTANSNRSAFSNFGTRTVQIAAPGATLSSNTGGPRVVTGLYSSLPGSTWGDTFQGNPYGGTSMASPLVAGAAALARGFLHSKRGPQAATPATPALIKSYLLNSAIKNTTLASTVQEGRILNVAALGQRLAAGGPNGEPIGNAPANNGEQSCP